jgi:aryl-alcohol dehydrogenase-like predicted oxidoreductase
MQAASADSDATAKTSAANAGTFVLGGDLKVNRLGFGAMRITGDGIWGPPKDPAEAQRVLHRALDLGVTLIDTADSYGPEVSEQLIHDALHPYPKGLVIATKGGLVRPGPNRWDHDGRPEHLREACDASLKRLQLERIDVYQFHSPDPNVPLEDSIGELAKLQKAGKIRHVGVSNVNVAQLKQAQSITKIVSVQNRYNVQDRSSEDVLKYCEANKLGFLPWAPLDSGRLPANLQTLATTHNVSTVQIALAWLLARSPVMLPIPGTSSTAHLEDNVAAAGLHLTAAELASLG